MQAETRTIRLQREVASLLRRVDELTNAAAAAAAVSPAPPSIPTPAPAPLPVPVVSAKAGGAALPTHGSHSISELQVRA
jgi:hypothetical protein